jgi:N-acetyltransferase
VLEYEIDDEPGRVDADAAVEFLTTLAYWGRWRGADDIKAQIRDSWRVVGAYDAAGNMVGFARAAGDGANAYLADVYVLPEHRGAGLGKALVRAMVEEGPGAGVRWMLHTQDAHGLYRQFGFAGADGRYLERPSAQAGPVAAPVVPGVLTGELVRLEPLAHEHLAGLLGAVDGGGELYRWTVLPADEAGMRAYVEAAVAGRDRGAMAPFAVVRLADEKVIGSTRFFDLGYWAWARELPDTCEIGYTWLAKDAIRTGANTEMKRLMLTYAFETWGVRSVCLHTDARNERSRAAMERIGLRLEGILRAHRLASDGGPRDSARYCVTFEEWPAMKALLSASSARSSSTILS